MFSGEMPGREPGREVYVKRYCNDGFEFIYTCLTGLEKEEIQFEQTGFFF